MSVITFSTTLLILSMMMTMTQIYGQGQNQIIERVYDTLIKASV